MEHSLLENYKAFGQKSILTRNSLQAECGLAKRPLMGRPSLRSLLRREIFQIIQIFLLFLFVRFVGFLPQRGTHWNCNKKSKISCLWLINSLADFRTSIFALWAGKKFLQAWDKYFAALRAISIFIIDTAKVRNFHHIGKCFSLNF